MTRSNRIEADHPARGQAAVPHLGGPVEPEPRRPVERRPGIARARLLIRHRRPRSRTRRIVLQSVLAAVLAFVAVVTYSLVSALTAPGTDSFQARLAEWGRDHGLGFAVTWLENEQYRQHRPRVGGSVPPDQLRQMDSGAFASHSPVKPIVPIVTPALPGEGQWHVLVAAPDGTPLVQKALLRPDPQHTSYLAYVAWINTTRVKFQLHPGYSQPGGNWQASDQLQAGHRTGLIATLNGGFKIRDSMGGYYAEGRTVRPLIDGQASEVYYADGSMTVAAWGRDATMGPRVVAVRQNLQLLVDGGRVTVSTGDGPGKQWGQTVKNSYFVWRSGIGVTADGSIVYAMGPALSVHSLAVVLQRAGAVRAMELDINPDWVSFMVYLAHPDPSDPVPLKLTDFVQPADRYYHPSSRDFVAVYSR